jgi:hypothetical protein
MWKIDILSGKWELYLLGKDLNIGWRGFILGAISLDKVIAPRKQHQKLGNTYKLFARGTTNKGVLNTWY